jgi:hypothetical protein
MLFNSIRSNPLPKKSLFQIQLYRFQKKNYSFDLLDSIFFKEKCSFDSTGFNLLQKKLIRSDLVQPSLKNHYLIIFDLIVFKKMFIRSDSFQAS